MGRLPRGVGSGLGLGRVGAENTETRQCNTDGEGRPLGRVGPRQACHGGADEVEAGHQSDPEGEVHQAHGGQVDGHRSTIHAAAAHDECDRDDQRAQAGGVQQGESCRVSRHVPWAPPTHRPDVVIRPYDHSYTIVWGAVW